MGQKLSDSPIPTSVDKADFDENILDTFVDLVSQIATPMFDQGALRWEAAVETAKKLGVSNDWSKRALQRLNNYAPGKWSMLRDEIIVKEVVP
jgi:hypothetical protein